MSSNTAGSSGQPSRTQLLRERAREAEARNGGSTGKRSDDGRDGSREGGLTLSLWEKEQRGRLMRRLGSGWVRVRTPARLVGFTALAFVLGLQLAARPEGARLASLENALEDARVSLTARHGELELVRMEMSRLQEIMDYSRKYSVPADLATSIYDIALAEGIAPSLGFRLVEVESGFYRRAVSPKGAVGLAQLMPATAFELDPNLEYRDLFDSDTNLRLGFRYLRWLLNRYDGDLRIALLAYNRGLGTVDRIRAGGGDPANGYARAIMEGAK